MKHWENKIMINKIKKVNLGVDIHVISATQKRKELGI
jgi:hypothetical protein